jgi:hypothetical protein
MWRTINYYIWPRDMRFEGGLLALVDFAAKRKLKPSHGEIVFDNYFRINIDEFESVKCDGIEELVEVLRKTPVFERFECSPFFRGKRPEHFLRTGVSFDNRSVRVDVASQDVDLIEATHRFLKDTFNLRNPEIPTSPDDRPKYLHPTVFIGRHFDEVGNQYYATLSSFLQLLGFDVKQGEEYTSQAIPEKVKSRIESQDIFLGIVSGDRNHEWLIAEPSYALGKGKHVILVVEKEATYMPTILGQDLEKLRFDAGHIEQTFTPLLREFRSIRVTGI